MNGEKLCLNCGVMNDAEYLFCKQCGAPLTAQPYAAPPRTIEGVAEGDVAEFVGRKRDTYVPIFAEMSLTGKNKVNLLVLLIGLLVSPFIVPFWFFQKRMNKAGWLTFGILAAIQIISFAVSIPLMQNMLNLTASSAAEMEYILAESMGVGGLSIIVSGVSFLLEAVSFAMVIYCGIKCNRMYMNHCIGKIKGVSAASAEEYHAKLAELGGERNALWITLLVITVLALMLAVAATMAVVLSVVFGAMAV